MKLNQSHFLRWLELCGLVVDCAPDNGQQLVSSTNATIFLKLCAALGNTTREEAKAMTLSLISRRGTSILRQNVDQSQRLVENTKAMTLSLITAMTQISGATRTR